MVSNSRLFDFGSAPGTSRAEILRRFPSCRATDGFSFSGGEGHISDALGVTVALDEAGTVEAVEGQELELNGRVILNRQNLPRPGVFWASRLSGAVLTRPT